MRKTLPVLAALVLTAATAQAVEVPVRYSVSFKEYKQGVAQGTPLTFELHTDSACSGAFYSEVINGGDPGLRQAKIIVQKVKKQDPKPAKEMRLRAVLDPPPPLASPLYLRVTGVGIVGIGTDCQIQVPTVATHLAPPLLKDSTGAVLGIVREGVQIGFGGGVVPFFYTMGGRSVSLVVLDIGLGSSGLNFESGSPKNIFYESTDCSGPALIEDNGSSSFAIDQHAVVGTIVYLQDGPFSPTTSHSWKSSSFGCTASSATVDLAPTTSSDLSVFVPPFSVELQ